VCMPIIFAAISRHDSTCAKWLSRPFMPHNLSCQYRKIASPTQTGGILSAAVFRYVNPESVGKSFWRDWSVSMGMAIRRGQAS
jgi:hypothetical protein